MNRRKVFLKNLGTIFILLFITACCTPSATKQATDLPSAIPPTLTPSATITPSPAPAYIPPEHRIGVRVVDGIGEFYDRVTGEKFVPRGNNYIRLAQQKAYSGEIMNYHSTFNIGLYDPDQAEEALQRMHADGYNTVRVFVHGNCQSGCIADPAGGLNKEYIANVVDFLRKAKANEIYVILTTDGEPATPYYIKLLDTTWSEDFGGTNNNYLRGGGILVGKTFWLDFITELNDQHAPVDAILSYELRNEFFFETNAAPLNYTSGEVSTANGKTYDMSSEEEKLQMMDEGMVYYIDQIRAAILESDPTALVSMGFFPPDEPNPWPSAPRKVRTYAAIAGSTLDFLDFHPYPGGYSLDKLAENFQMAGLEEKPIIMGEFGASRSAYATEIDAAQALHDWEVDSCSYGFDGWLMWTWDSEEQTDFYNALMGDELINQVLAPVNRPDPCQAGVFDFFEYNLALGKATRASRFIENELPAGVVDGNTNFWWGAGDFAPQWIQIDLGEPYSVGMIRLVVSQSPAGNTTHQIWMGTTSDQLTLVHTFEGYTTDNQVLEYSPETPLENVRYVRVVTKASPSWVAWKEIEVLK
jgi:hypothetical protein